MSLGGHVRQIGDGAGSAAADESSAANEWQDGLLRDWFAGATGRPSRLAEVKGEPSDRKRGRESRRDRSDDAANRFFVNLWTVASVLLWVAAAAITIYVLRIATGAETIAPWLKAAIPAAGGCFVSGLGVRLTVRFFGWHPVSRVHDMARSTLRWRPRHGSGE